MHQKYRAELSPIRPINNVKIYGADTGKYGKTQDGLARFWRNIFGGFALSTVSTVLPTDSV